MHKPTFLIIGAQKCGTTWLHEHLRKHPDVFLPVEKELEFFSYQAHLLDAGFDRYLQHFASADHSAAIGEASASYFWTGTDSQWSVLPDGFQTNIPGTVRQYLGDELRLIVTLRNPVERVISAYLHYLAMGELTTETDFAEAMSYGGIVDMGFYARHLRNWLEYYPQEQIKVLTMESDIQTNPVETLNAVCHFLAIENHDFGTESVQRAVYPGGKRLVNDNGIFVVANGAFDATGEDAFEDDEGRKWRRIITADRLRQLNSVYLPDVKDLDSLLGTSLVQCWGLTA